MEECKEQQPQHASTQAYSDACAEDEINLLDLWRVLVRQWKVIGAITFLSILGAVVYLFLATPVYQVQAVLRPPGVKDVENLNIAGISQISSAELFTQLTGNLKSSSLFQQFFNENPQLFPNSNLFVDKNAQLFFLRNNLPEIKDGGKKEADFVFVSLQGQDSKLLADRVNGFILLVERETINNFLAGVETNIVNRKKDIENQLQIGMDFATKRRQDRIFLLEDQIAIAQASNIFERKLSTYSTMNRQSVGVTLNTAEEPLYMRGVKELSAEKKELETRKNDEPFIVGFRDKQESLAQLDAGLKQLQAARAIAHAVTIDQLAIQSKIPVSPRRMRVLALSVMLGGIMGVFAAFVVNVIEQQKKR
ncbi:MAG: hypothetical protein KJ555_08230 [Proteobacteria bacterium]|nr:hypothetical protein [Pseudomonadota bacterium]